ncbi:hypothetical protein DMN91_003598, partial [Ooceraea biroi]
RRGSEIAEERSLAVWSYSRARGYDGPSSDSLRAGVVRNFAKRDATQRGTTGRERDERRIRERACADSRSWPRVQPEPAGCSSRAAFFRARPFPLSLSLHVASVRIFRVPSRGTRHRPKRRNDSSTTVATSAIARDRFSGAGRHLSSNSGRTSARHFIGRLPRRVPENDAILDDVIDLSVSYAP